MELYRKIHIKSEADLPKSERAMYFVGVKDNLNPEDLYEWFNYKNPVMADNQAEYWINTFDWYLQPIEITELQTPIEDGLYSTGRFTQDECSVLAEGLLSYINDYLK